MRLSLLVALPLSLCLLSACQRAPAPDDKQDANNPSDVTADVKPDDKKKEDKTAGPRTWSSWRGHENTGVSREKDLPETFSLTKKQNVVFAVNQGSITTPIVQNGMVYLLGKSGSGETQ